MRFWLALLAATSMLSGCFYVSKTEYDELWDADGDGWPFDMDCNDNDPDIRPDASDIRGDGCDADCGTESDKDVDDWPDDADCDPENGDIYPCSPAEVEGDGIDSDCDGFDGIRTDTCPKLNFEDPDAVEFEGGCDTNAGGSAE